MLTVQNEQAIKVLILKQPNATDINLGYYSVTNGEQDQHEKAYEVLFQRPLLKK